MKVNHNKHGKYWVPKNEIATRVHHAKTRQSREYPIAITTIESNHEDAVGNGRGQAAQQPSKCWESMRFCKSLIG